MIRPVTGVRALATKLAKVEYARPAVSPASKLNFSAPADRFGANRLATRLCHEGLLKPCDRTNVVGLAERGQRREKGPLSGLIKPGLDSYIDSDSL